jgi:hypothetical protein
MGIPYLKTVVATRCNYVFSISSNIYRITIFSLDNEPNAPRSLSPHFIAILPP